MSPDHALALISELLHVAFAVTGPVLAACLVGGVFVGILQTATQINEASISYVVKAGIVVALLLLLGTEMADQVTMYTRKSIAAIADVGK